MEPVLLVLMELSQLEETPPVSPVIPTAPNVPIQLVFVQSVMEDSSQMARLARPVLTTLIQTGRSLVRLVTHLAPTAVI